MRYVVISDFVIKVQGKERAIIVIGLVALAAFVSVLGATLILTTSESAEENDYLMEGPTPEEMPFWVDDFSGIPYPPSRELPSTGAPHLRAIELHAVPDVFNQVNYDEERWLQVAVDNEMENVRMNEDLLSEFYAYYKRVGNNVIHFEVTYPEGIVKCYAVRYSEIP